MVGFSRSLQAALVLLYSTTYRTVLPFPHDQSNMAEKVNTQAMEIEHGRAISPTKHETSFECSEADRKAVLRKMDMRIPPVLMMLYGKLEPCDTDLVF